jgi:hypothetical protein
LLCRLLNYDQERAAVAKRLGIRKSALDIAVMAKRKALGEDDGESEQAALGPEPWPTPIGDIGAVLSEASEELVKDVVAPQVVRDTDVLWALHAHFVHHPFIELEVSPRLAIQAVSPICGKTTLLELTGFLVSRPLPSASLTPALVYRVLDALHPTMLLDECDVLMRSNRNPELVALLNASHHRRTANIPRLVPTPDGNWEVRMFSAWCTYAFTAIGKLEDTLQSRSISFVLLRARPDEVVPLQVAPMPVENAAPAPRQPNG